MARNAAFLDPKNEGYAAVRAADAATGRFRQGDGYFYNTDDGFVKVDESTWKAGKSAPISAQQLLKGKVGEVKQTLVPANTPDVTDPESEKGSVVDKIGHTFQGDEFEYNNNPPTGDDGVVDKWTKGMKDRYFGKYDDKGSQGNPEGGTQGRVPLNAG